METLGSDRHSCEKGLAMPAHGILVGQKPLQNIGQDESFAEGDLGAFSKL